MEILENTCIIFISFTCLSFLRHNTKHVLNTYSTLAPVLSAFYGITCLIFMLTSYGVFCCYP